MNPGETESDEFTRCKNNLITKNSKISPETALKICEIINNLYENQKDEIPNIFESALNEWFSEISVVEEIFKTINSKDLCFLHNIVYLEDLEIFAVRRHIGKDNNSIEEMDFKRYYNDQIKGCEANLIAIPLNYENIEKGDGHATMIVIEKRKAEEPWFSIFKPKPILEIEHFDSSHIDTEKMKEPLEELIKSLYDENEFDIRFHYPEDVCDIPIQGAYLGSKYSGSCTQFAMWYAFKRLLEPDKSRDYVVEEMLRIFESDKETRDKFMIDLIKTFQKLVHIHFTEDGIDSEGTVNDRDFASRKAKIRSIGKESRKRKQENISSDAHETKSSPYTSQYVLNFLHRFEKKNEECEHLKIENVCKDRNEMRETLKGIIYQNRENPEYKDLVSRYENLAAGGGRGRKTRRKIKKRRGRKPKSAKKHKKV